MSFCPRARRQASGPWHEPGIGGLVYNPPNIVHAMRSAEGPLLALWFLWTGSDTPAVATDVAHLRYR